MCDVPGHQQQPELPFQRVLQAVLQLGVGEQRVGGDIGHAQRQHGDANREHGPCDTPTHAPLPARAAQEQQLGKIAGAEIDQHAVTAQEAVGLAFRAQEGGVQCQRDRGKCAEQGHHATLPRLAGGVRAQPP
jgi:hypothetical protein